MGLVRYDEVRKIVLYSACTTCGIALGDKLVEGLYGVKDKASKIYHGARGGEVKKPQGGDLVPREVMILGSEVVVWPRFYTGLRIILERKIQNVTIESDSITAVNLIKEGNPNNHPQSVLINDAHFIMAKTNTLLEHTYRSANQCADHLARMGVEQTDGLVFVMDMPISMREFLLRDRLNIRQVLD